ncbi:MAG: AAA family ATPase, partial [Methylococcales bacterium]
LLHGVVHGNGFVALTGEVGTGKTTLCNCLINQLPEKVDLALLLNPRVNAEELLATLCDELEIAYPEGNTRVKVWVDLLTAHLLKVHAQGRNTVLLIDEAQTLSIHVLEQIRLLTNLETNDTKLLQIILVGQPELNQLLAKDNLRQLNQRITARYHIDPLSLSDCRAYIEHRLRVAGSDLPVFSRRAVNKVFQFSGGIPRLINIICDRAMLGAYSLGTRRVEARIVSKAAREVLLPSSLRSGWYSDWKWLLPVALVSVFSGLFVFGFMQRFPFFPEKFEGVEAEAAKPSQPAADADSSLAGPIPPDQTNLDKALVGTAKPDVGGAPKQSLDIASTAMTRSASESVRESSTAENKISEPLSAQSEAVQTAPVSVTDEPEIHFIDRIADPGLTLNAVLPELFRRWDPDYDPQSGNFCESARVLGLRCLIQQGTWNYLVSLNWPATLEFVLNRGVTRYATLIQVDDTSATFIFLNDDALSFPISEVLPYWQGQFALLWKAPAEYKSLMTRGYSNPAVPWLRQQLRPKDANNDNNAASDFFDQELENQVIAFQTAQGLNPDGKVGTETILLLSSLNGSS